MLLFALSAIGGEATLGNQPKRRRSADWTPFGFHNFPTASLFSLSSHKILTLMSTDFDPVRECVSGPIGRQ
jgi:hypothetical protein